MAAKQGPRAQYLTDDRVDSLAGVVADEDRWRWGEEGRGSRGRANDRARSEDRQQNNVFQPPDAQHLHVNNTNSTGEQVSRMKLSSLY